MTIRTNIKDGVETSLDFNYNISMKKSWFEVEFYRPCCNGDCIYRLSKFDNFENALDYYESCCDRINNEFYTWDDLYVRAAGTAHLSKELNAKDNARGYFEQLIPTLLQPDEIDDDCFEETIDYFIDKFPQDFLFDEDGNFVKCGAKTPATN